MDSLLNLIILASLGLLAQGQELEYFHHRTWHAAIVLGDYLYMDGGELSTWNQQCDGYWENSFGDIISGPANCIYVVDLTKSWTNESVEILLIPKTTKPVPRVNWELVWADQGETHFYSSMGSFSGNLMIEDPRIPDQTWQFVPSGSTGTWSLVANRSTYGSDTPITRVQGGIYASGNGVGYALGGVQTYDTSTEVASGEWVDVPGMVIFNSTSGTAYNVSGGSWNYYGTLSNGAAHFVPVFGPAGLVFVFGGSDTFYNLAGSPLTGSVFSPLSFNTIYMYEPDSRKWLSQQVSGDIPPPLLYPCVTGIEGDNRTYEIFLFGGVNPTSTDISLSMGAVHVLSLPSFHWQKQDYDSQYSRYGHQCNVAGNSQMIVTGGEVFDRKSAKDRGEPYGWPIDDPWLMGIGVFDMSNLEWKDMYDSDADAYTTPEIVKDYIDENGPYPSIWSDSSVADLFLNKGPNSASPSPGESKSLATGGIAGVVVGSAAGIAGICGAIFYLLRRRKQKARMNADVTRTYRKPELEDTSPTMRKQPDTYPVHLEELPTRARITEVPETRSLSWELE